MDYIIELAGFILENQNSCAELPRCESGLHEGAGMFSVAGRPQHKKLVVRRGYSEGRLTRCCQSCISGPDALKRREQRIVRDRVS
ncbi:MULTISPECIES: hypothetical protein [unclassified Nitrobacter]|uniref:hypothetical protein n=1 Tax=unclassified Nitrobacter TaxID=2620411 RepID=UPI00103DBDB5|nr:MULTISPECIES: hypothetical protein [unclassified Nitrobacter]MCB1393422.1 hypothetical protein [Nitrobacter sp.]MCV0387019.1 hypothetical protein [Nitrobacter sp.]